MKCMASWLFVDGLVPTVTPKDLTAVLAPYGAVERVLIFKASTGSHIAFVEIAADGDMTKATQAIRECESLGDRRRALKIPRP